RPPELSSWACISTLAPAPAPATEAMTRAVVPLSPRAGRSVLGRIAHDGSGADAYGPRRPDSPIIGGASSDAWRTMSDVSRTAGGLRAGLRRSNGCALSQHGSHLELSAWGQRHLRDRSEGVRSGQRDGAGAGRSGWC